MPLFRILNPVCLTPVNRNRSQRIVAVRIPIVGNAVLVNAVFEAPKFAPTSYRITQSIPHLIVSNRIAKAFHNPVFVDVELGR